MSGTREVTHLADNTASEYFSTSVDNLFLKWSDHDTACDET